MRTLFVFCLLAIAGIVQSQTIPNIPHRGKIMQVYEGDTLYIEFTDAGVNLVTNLPGVTVNGGTVSSGQSFIDTLSFTDANQDTLYFPVLSNAGRVVEYSLTADTLNAADVTVTLEEMYAGDTVYTSMSSTVFPLTLGQKDVDVEFHGDSVWEHNRVIINWGTATEGIIYVRRKIHIMSEL